MSRIIAAERPSPCAHDIVGVKRDSLVEVDVVGREVFVESRSEYEEGFIAQLTPKGARRLAKALKQAARLLDG